MKHISHESTVLVGVGAAIGKRPITGLAISKKIGMKITGRKPIKVSVLMKIDFYNVA